MSRNREHLLQLLPKLRTYLESKLLLSLHPKKTSLRTVASGIDFLGWVHFPHHRVIRTSTKKRALGATSRNVTSYLGLLSHGNTYKLRHRLLSSL